MAFRNIPPNGFPALPDVEDLEAVEKDVTTLKSSVLGLTQDVTDLNAQKANQITIAPFFNSETSYDVGDLVYYNGLTYRCTNEHEGEWDADDFAGTTIANELDTLRSGLIKPNYTNRVNISDYDSESNAYTAPSNGFVTFRLISRSTTNTGYNVYIDGVSMYSGYNNAESSVNFTAPIGRGSTIYTTKQSNVTALVAFVPYDLG